MAMEKTTRFSLACGLLSKMVKEKQQQGISFDGTHRRQPLATMDLLSGIDVSADDDTTETEKETAKPDQLTIFYDGKMFVFDDIVEEKENDLMQSAAASISCCPMAMAPAKLNFNINMNMHGMNLLAQTRKASLHRFLNKRKERINAKAPYQQKIHAYASASAKAEAEETRSWLALGH